MEIRHKKPTDRPIRQLMDRLLATPGYERHSCLADALAHCVLNNADGETVGCPLSRLFLLDQAASQSENHAQMTRTIGDRLHTLLMGEAIWGKNTHYLDMLLSCEHFAKQDTVCSLHRILKIAPLRSPH